MRIALFSRISASSVLAVFAFVLGACSNQDLPKYQKLGGLRILEIQADHPEIASTGGSVMLTPLVSDFGGAGRALRYDFEACKDPGISYGASVSCDADPARQTGGSTFSLPSGTGYTGNAPAFSVAVPADVLSGWSPSDQYNGISFIVIYRVTVIATGEVVSGIKRILVSTRTSSEKNSSNPLLLSVQASGTAITGSLPTTETDLTPEIPSGTAESYQLLSSSGQSIARTEKLTVTWFVSDGEMERSRTDGTSSNLWKPPTSPATAPFMVVILRDDRGGSAFKIVGP